MSLPSDRRAATAVAERPAAVGERAGTAAPLLRAVTWRSLLISLLLIPPNAYWLVQMERVRYSAHPTTISLFFNVVFILLVVTVLNAGLARLWPRMAMRSEEHTSELQSRQYLVCRLLLEKKKKKYNKTSNKKKEKRKLVSGHRKPTIPV